MNLGAISQRWNKTSRKLCRLKNDSGKWLMHAMLMNCPWIGPALSLLCVSPQSHGALSSGGTTKNLQQYCKSPPPRRFDDASTTKSQDDQSRPQLYEREDHSRHSLESFGG